MVGVASGAFGCLNRPLEPVEPRTTSTIVERLTQSSVDKIDLLLALDNSRSMADKQQILALAVPDLVKGLVNPACVNPSDPAVPPVDVAPGADCPTGLEREFDPVNDIHIGIITSSLGGHGSDACGASTPETATNDDKGHLIAREADVNGNPVPGSSIETYLGKGFLAWDPTQKLKSFDQAGNPSPAPGEADIEDADEAANPAADGNSTSLVGQLTEMVKGVGQIGCGYEAQLESWYRFLVDPEPYETISAETGTATPAGVDTSLLQQRADFMRPDSLLAIIVLTDENDCSIKEYGQFFYAAQQNAGSGKFRLPRPRSECATNPNDPCCLSCGQGKPAECPDDPTCKNPDGSTAALTEIEDMTNLRCFDQKRRFGIDFLYPVDRYVKALSDVTIQNRAGELVPNPLFSDLNPHDDISAIRDTGLVFFAGIVGVPWQDIARQDANGAPDLLTGNNLEGQPVGGFKNSDELRQPNGAFASTWDIILGTPAEYVAPADPLMIESIDPRSGTNPITGDAIAPVNAPNGTNPINGHEWTISSRADLQYACIFDLPAGAERDCSVPGTPACDCDPGNDNPLCEANPADNNERTLQVRAKAYPGIRELSVIKGVGAQGIVGSVCPKQLDTPTSPDFGYRPAIGAIIDRLKTALGGQCLPRTLTPDPNTGYVSCLILEARNSQGSCDCNLPGRQPVSTDPDHTPAKQAVLADPLAKASGWDCVCEVVQIPNKSDAIDDAAEKEACQQSTAEPVLTANGEEVNGWCYIDATTSPPTGNPDIVADCPATEQRIIRFVGKGEAQAGATLFITCSGE
ncbi:MAG: hypothetical protein IT372_13115 [Polyangiaceae bacterium]|nr:hypothetical protein [Polyangiaceae bacterium]